MNLHEYQSKRLFADYGIPVPRGVPANSPNEAVDATKKPRFTPAGAVRPAA